MPYLQEPFDATNVPEQEDTDDFEPIPAGIYPMTVTASDIKQTKSQNGQYIEFEFTVMGEKYPNRKIWTRLNIVNPNKFRTLHSVK